MSDDSMGANPEVATALTQQMVGGLETAHYGFPLYSRLRYFAPERRPGIPANVAALVDSMSATEVAVTLVNLDQTEARTVVVQAGAYGEHRFAAAAGSARATAPTSGCAWSPAAPNGSCSSRPATPSSRPSRSLGPRRVAAPRHPQRFRCHKAFPAVLKPTVDLERFG